MIRHALLAGTALLSIVAASPAYAQWEVNDPGTHINTALTLAQAIETVVQLKMTYDQIVSTYEAIAHAPDGITGLASALNAMGMRNPYPQTGQVPGIVNGTGFGSISGLAQQFMALNRYHTPEGDDFAAQEMLRRAQATAGVQGMALQAMQAVEKRAEDLGVFLAAIGDSPDIQQTMAINARLQLEQNFVAGQQAQAQQLAVLQHAQDDVARQRAEEKHRQDYEELANETGGFNAGNGAAGAVLAGGN